MRALLSLVFLIAVSACSSEETSGPGEIRWDKEVCVRCAMAIGDKRFAAQIRGGAEKKLYRFDDIGCAVIWLDGQSWKTDAVTEIWISDYQSSHWIDARQAWFFPVLQSPMGYGLAAQKEYTENALNFDQAVLHIHAVENREHLHGDQHQHTIDPAN